MMRKFAAKNLHRWVYVALLAALVGLRLLIAGCQRVFLLPEGSGIDDMLMVRAAMSLSDGNWLGAYGGMAIAKNMGFAFWLAALHKLGLPLLLSNAALWLAACGFAVRALRPLLPGNLVRLCVFALFSFVPPSFAAYTMRAYRDGIFMSVSLLFFAGVLGLGLRLSQPKMRGSVFCAVGAGLGFAAAWLTREDGIVLLAFAVCGLLLVALFALFSKTARRRVGKVVCAALPFVFLLAGILGISAGNNAHYGVFAVNDMSSGSFPGAYGALVGVSAAESGHVRATPVTQKALERLYAEVPAMAQLQGQLEQGLPIFNGFGNKTTGEYGGSFYFALRLAADYAGLTPDGKTAQDFWARMQAETEQAVAEGRLQSAGTSAGTIPRWNASLLGPTVEEMGRGVLHLLTFQECDPRPVESIGYPEGIQAVADFLHERTQTGYIAGTDTPYYNFLQRAVFLLCDVLVWLYRILVWPLLALGLAGLCKGLGRAAGALGKKRGLAPVVLLSVLALGLLLSVVVRFVVAAYMETAAFLIGTYLMYLVGAAPPLLLLFVCGPACGFGREGEEA